MKIPLSWIKEFVNIDVPVRRFMEDITLSGTIAETYEKLGADIDKVVVGRVDSIEQHPNADKLVITKVDIGETDKLQIVTGAINLKEGDYVPVALHGASLANGLVIKKGKLRGEVSEGMLCSIEELGNTRQDYPEAPEDGIYVFSERHPLGADARPILQLQDDVIDFEIYSNRPDCQSVYGMVREIAATYNKAFELPAINVKEQADGQASDFVEVEIQNPDLCPRYVARVVKNIKIGPSPQWMRRRLTMSGLRPINNIVDITNYVMLEYGQPLHAFDIDHIALGPNEKRKIIVRNSNKDENFVTLDGVERKLDETMLVIADPEKAVALAGIMGGENSKVTENASAVLFESACFNGTNIRLNSRKLGMRTDASGKFEKGLDPNLPLTAVNRAMELIEELGCGEVVPGVVDNYPSPREKRRVMYSPDNINKLLGTNINPEEMELFLARVDIITHQRASNNENNEYEAEVPTYRQDITQEADIAEEVARFFGYNNIPVNKAQRNILGGGKTAYQRGEDLVKRTMAALGYSEAMTSSFEGPKVHDKLNLPPDSPLRNAVVITNPLGADFSMLRTSPYNGMLESLSVNFNRRNESARLFELTKVYLPRHEENPGELPEEPIYLVIGAYDRAGIDFFDLKGDIEEFFDTLGIKHYEFDACSENLLLHPKRAAIISIGDRVGEIGEVHPIIANTYEMETRAYIAVLELTPIINGITNSAAYVPLNKYPAIVRDIALQVKEDVPAAAIMRAIKEKAGPLLAGLKLFDVYQGKQVEEGHKSMAYSLTFRAADRNLTEAEVMAPVNSVLEHLQESLGIQLRDR